jgi:hypothetical protein
MGLNISADPNTEPFGVRNISFTREPWYKGLGSESRPPVRETIWSLPRVRQPLWKRRTAGVVSLKRVRGARLVACCGEGSGISVQSSMCGRWEKWEVTEGMDRNRENRRLMAGYPRVMQIERVPDVAN